MDAVGSATVLGFALGLQHATDPDHLVAVATIVTRERRFTAGALVGALWGAGHMLTLTLAGSLVLALGLEVPRTVAVGLELGVAAMLVALGVMRLRDAVHDLRAVSPEHLVADHDHASEETVHTHAHVHGDDLHLHAHVHPSRALLGALRRRPGALAMRAMAVGAVHGLAGSAAVSLLLLSTLGSARAAAVYLLVFGLGTVGGMTVFTAALACPVGVALRFTRARRMLAFGTSLVSIAFGLVYAWRAI
jgi:high-affinity nickel-transport protein